MLYRFPVLVLSWGHIHRIAAHTVSRALSAMCRTYYKKVHYLGCLFVTDYQYQSFFYLIAYCTLLRLQISSALMVSSKVRSTCCCLDFLRSLIPVLLYASNYLLNQNKN